MENISNDDYQLFSDWLKKRNNNPFTHEFIQDARTKMTKLYGSVSIYAVNDFICSLGKEEYMDYRWFLSCLLRNIEFPYISQVNHN